MKTFKEFSTILSEKGQSYIVRDQERRMQQQQRQGINPDNPSRMNTNLHLGPTRSTSMPEFVPSSTTPVKINKPRSREFGHGRSLKSLIGTAGEA